MDRLHPIPLGAEEFYINLPNASLEGLIWGAKNPEHKTIYALHGWLDNAMTFANLAPMFAEAGWRFVALEMPGHGKSPWLHKQASYNLFETVASVMLALQSLSKGEKLNLLAHSLGGIVFAFLTAAKNDRINKLVLIDSLGTLVNPITKSAKYLNTFLDKWQKQVCAKSNHLVVYPSIEKAAQARTQGILPISFDASLQLCQRGLKPTKGGFCWNSDSKLLLPNAISLTEEQNLALLSGIEVPVLEIAGTAGFITTNPKIQKRLDVIQNAELVVIEGNHHLHLEESTFAEVGQAALEFFVN